MKIGAFAKKYNMNVTAVRYYVEKALLTPKRKNNQYIFDQSCMDDMEKIRKYKEYRMTLEEIELLFFLEKTSNFKDETVLQIIRELFLEKRQELKRERDALDEIIHRLEQEADRFASMQISENQSKPGGIPIAFTQYLYCPHCKIPLRLESADIVSGRIAKGRLCCDCGYTAAIENGMILCKGHMEDTPFKVFDNVESVLSVVDEYSDSYRVLVDKAYLWMYHQISNHKEKQMMMAGPFTSNFLLKNCKNFGSDHTVIIVDPSVKRISKLQKYMADYEFQVIYIAGDIEHIPLKDGCIDIYIDDFSVTDYIFTYNESLYKYLSSKLKRDGFSIGVFGDYAKAPQTLENFKKDHPNFMVEKMKFSTIEKDLFRNDMYIKEKKIIGSTRGDDQHFPRNAENEQVMLLGYRTANK